MPFCKLLNNTHFFCELSLKLNFTCRRNMRVYCINQVGNNMKRDWLTKNAPNIFGNNSAVLFYVLRSFHSFSVYIYFSTTSTYGRKDVFFSRICSQCVCGREGVSLSTTSRVWMWGWHEGVSSVRTSGCIPLPCQQGWTWECLPFHSQQCKHEGVFLSTNSSMDVRFYPFLQSIAVDVSVSVSLLPPTVWTWGCILSTVNSVYMGMFPFQQQQCGLEGVSLSTVNSVGIGVFF